MSRPPGLEWVMRGACKGADPDLFYPPTKGGDTIAQVRAAKVICQGCEVRQECLDYAVDACIEDGIWGGMGRDERRNERLRRRRVARRRRLDPIEHAVPGDGLYP